MAVDRIRVALEQTPGQRFDLYERRPGDFQVILPILHEDGDMVDIYLQEAPHREGFIRVCDFGHALMRLSYTFEVNSPTRQKILDSILYNNDVTNSGGNLYIETPIDKLYEGILQFAGCVQKVCNMRYWSRESVRSLFYEDLKEHVETSLADFSPKPDLFPLDDNPLLSVDWSLTCNNRDLFLFGVRGSDKAKNVAISLLEFQKVGLPFISLVVHEDMQDLGRMELSHLTRNADKQYPELGAFREDATQDIPRLAGVVPL